LRDVPQCRDYFLAEKVDGEYHIKYKLDGTSQDRALALVDSFPKGDDRDHRFFRVTATGFSVNGSGILTDASFATCFEDTNCDGVCSGSCDTPTDPDFIIPPGFLLVGHVVCMCLSWGCLLPMGVIWAHYLRKSQWKPGGVPAWFAGHWKIQSIGVFLQLLGFFFILIWKKAAHFKLPHEIIGLVVVLLGTLQPLNAQLRHFSKVGHPDHPGPFRKTWEFLHKGSGFTAVFLGIVNVIYGPIHAANMRFSSALPVAAGVFVALSVGTLLATTIYCEVKQMMACKDKRAADPDASTVGKQSD
jgi:hypothetical protein